MSNFIYYEKLEDYEEQVKKKAKLCDEKDKEIERLKEEYRITCKQKNNYISTLEGSLGIAEEKYLRLNNIINELEKELNKDFNTYMIRNRQYGKVYKAGADNYRMYIYLKLQELKGDNSNENQ